MHELVTPLEKNIVHSKMFDPEDKVILLVLFVCLVAVIGYWLHYIYQRSKRKTLVVKKSLIFTIPEPTLPSYEECLNDLPSYEEIMTS